MLELSAVFQAAAEWVSVAALVGNGVLSLWLYRLRYMFVGHVEFRALREQVVSIDTRLASLVTRDDVQLLSNRIGSMEAIASRLNAQLEGNRDSVERCNNLLNMLLENELTGKRAL
jgi:hypothetical protein